MHAYSVTGTSENPSEALGSAIASSLRFAGGVEIMHVVVLGVAKVGGVWKAFVSVVTEEEAELEPLRPEGGEEALLAAREEKEERRRREREHDADMERSVHEMEETLHWRDVLRQHEEELELDILADIYMDMTVEAIVHPIAGELHAFTIHYIPEGPWEEIRAEIEEGRIPDMAFYRATHAVEEGTRPEEVQEISMQPSPEEREELLEELNED